MLSSLVQAQRDSGRYTVFSLQDTLLLEVCDYSTYSMCSDGYEQPYRMFPVLVRNSHAKASLFFDNYLDTVFMFYTESIKEFEKGKYDHCFPDTFVDSISANARIQIISSHKFQIRVNSFFRRNHIFRKPFKGFKFAVIAGAKHHYFYAGKINLMIPDLTSKKGLIKNIETNLVYIIP